MSRLQTHISFEELDDYVQLASVSKWEFRLSVAFPSVVLSPDMVVTVCTAIRQSVKQVSHDSILLVNMDCSGASLSDDSLQRLLAETAPPVMRKSGRVAIEKLLLSNNELTEKSVDEILTVPDLNKDAKYKYRTKTPLAADCRVDLSGNRIRSLDSVIRLLAHFPPSTSKRAVLLQVGGNLVPVAAVQKLISAHRLTICSAEEPEGEETCAGTLCVGKCVGHLSADSVVQSDQFSTPPAEPTAPDYRPPSIEEMTKALLAGLKISPDSSAASSEKKPSKPVQSAPARETTEDISKSLLNLLHASANKLKEGAAGPLPGSRTLSDLEASMRQAAVSSPPMRPVDKTPTPLRAVKQYVTVRVPLRVFVPFAGATPLCGLELRVDPLGYRVVRVTEKPGQDNNVREGDVITAIDGEPLVALPGVGESEREKAIRGTFGRRLKDGVQLIIQRPQEVTPADLNPDNNVIVERRLDFGLMLLGAGIDWRGLAAKFPLAVQQANVVCQSLGIEGKLEPGSAGTDASPLLMLRGPAGLVDKAMRQFCVVIVKGALVQQQQQATA